MTLKYFDDVEVKFLATSGENSEVFEGNYLIARMYMTLNSNSFFGFLTFLIKGETLDCSPTNFQILLYLVLIGSIASFIEKFINCIKA